MIRIDTHAHVFSKQDQCIATARYNPDYDATVEQYIQHLDAHGFTHGVLVQPSFLGTNNQAMLTAIRQYPQRLKGIAVVHPHISILELADLKSKGIVGIRLNLFGISVPDLSQTQWKMLIRNLEQLDLQLELHAPPAYLIQILPMLNTSKIEVVIDHFGRALPQLGLDDPDYQKFLSLLDVKQHWIKISGYYRLGAAPENIETAQKAYRLLKEKGFLHKMIWGSDWPHTQHESIVSYQQVLDAFHQIVPFAEEQDLVLGQNAAKLFHF